MLNTNAQFLSQELMDVVRLFGDLPDIEHAFRAEGDCFLNDVSVGGLRRTFCERQAYGTELEYKRYARRFAKLALYETLRELTGRRMPWGALTGIRPTKLAYAERAAGRRFEPLFEKFGVSRENIALVADVLRAQEGIYAPCAGTDLYVGIPFCPSKCSYCSFITADIRATGKYMQPYLHALDAEISACADMMSSLRSVYIGGGTPFAPDACEIEHVLRSLAPLVPAGTEYTVEAGRPDVITAEKLDLIAKYGATRVCVNPQTFCDETLARIGRAHTAADVDAAYALASRYPFSVNLDLIAGLPGETLAQFSHSIERAIALSPDNITVHTLCLKKGARLKEETARLQEGQIGDMIACAREALYAAGYVPYYLYRQKYMAGNFENTGWTKPGKACVYNVDVMEETCDNLACGANAVSKKLFSGGARIERVGAPKDIPTYIASIEKTIGQKRAVFCAGN